MRASIAVLAISGLFLSSLGSLAQPSGYPDLIGEWKGTNEGIVRGTGMYHRGNRGNEPRLVRKEFILNITGQEGRAFWGEIISNDDRGPMIGVLASDKETLQWVDSTGGHATGKLIAPNKFEHCYLRAAQDVMVATCNSHERR